MIKKIEGIVVGEISYKETSKIIKIFTCDGIINVLAKGSKKITNKNFTATTYLTYGSFLIYEHDLSILKSASKKKNYKNILKDIVKLSASSYIVSLITQVFKQNKSKELYSFLLSSLNKINDNINPLAIVNIIEVKLLPYLGLKLNLESCALCNNSNITCLSLDYSGFLCSNCSNIKMDKKILKLIKIYKNIELDKLESIRLDNSYLLFINKFLDDYYDKYTGLFLRQKVFFKDMYLKS